MPDHGRPIRFGSFLFPQAAAGPDLLTQAELAERLGYDFVAVPDHPPNPDYLDLWALLAAVIGRTTSLGVFSDVVNLALRPPAVLAKTVWSLDRLGPGRVQLGLGSGALWDQIAAFGGPRWQPGEAREHVAEAIAVIRRLWSGESPVTIAGKYYQVDGVAALAPPPRPIEIWIGSQGPLMRRLTAQVADGWIPNGNRITPELLAADVAHLDAELAAAGRQPGDVRRLCNAFFGKKLQTTAAGFLTGPADQWIEELTDLALNLGFDTFVLGDRETTVDHLHRFAEEVIPGVRAAVAAARGVPVVGSDA